jgi:hypothetical protein
MFLSNNPMDYVDKHAYLLSNLEPPPMPRINNHRDIWVSVPNVVTGVEGQSLYLHCSCNGGFPLVSAAWYVHGKPIASTLQTCDRTQNTGCSLTTEYTLNVTLEDDGVGYLC